MSSDARDWYAWHAPYDEPGSPLRRRLDLVQGHVRSWLDAHDGHELRVVSACAGQGRDLLEVLAGTPGASARVHARLVELDASNVAVAERAARVAGLAGVEAVCGDAGHIDAYLGALPADLVLMCGVFGNISDEDVHRTIGLLPQLCAADATVIWTRSRRAPDLTPAVRRWFAQAGFAERSYDAPSDALFSVGVHQLTGAPQAPVPGERFFRFVV
ncbi:MAG: SAM-dependent methyltransferase [Nocardioidaceae bacterium]